MERKDPRNHLIFVRLITRWVISLLLVINSPVVLHFCGLIKLDQTIINTIIGLDVAVVIHLINLLKPITK